MRLVVVLVLALLRWCRRFAVLLVFFAMLALNITTLTVPAVASIATGLVTSAGLTSAVRPAAKLRPVVSRIGRRVARGAARNVGALPAESVPWIGAGVAVAVTALELKDACDTMKDLRALEPAPGGGADGTTGEVCGLEVPSLAEIRDRIAERGALAEAGGWLGDGEPEAPGD
ncbi:MAG: hypothetical protein ACQEUZ_16700 [Pseudomonadota bacterium]